jgi:hypothetical protein
LVPGAPDDEGHAPKGEHALHQPWTFWYDVADMNTGGKKGDWGASLKKLLEFNSVEQFWVSGGNARQLPLHGPLTEQHAQTSLSQPCCARW